MSLRPRRWIGAVLLLGGFYLVDGIAFGALAGGAASERIRVTWRLAAWLTSGIAFAAHIGYEQTRMRTTVVATALHAASAAALGAFGLAAAATLRAAATGTGNLRLLVIALVAWPALTAVPAFLAALAAAAAVARMRRRA